MVLRILYVLSIALFFNVYAFASAPTSTITVSIINENVKPISEAKVIGGFSDNTRGYKQGSGGSGLSNDEGKVTISGPAYYYVDIHVTKEGYYKSKKRVEVNQVQEHDVSIILREKRNPVAMYAKKIALGASGTRKKDKQFGYDLIVGGFVQPHGEGVTNDFFVTHSGFRKDHTHYSYKLTINFSNKDDGVFPFYKEKNLKLSTFTSDYFVLTDEFKNQWVITESKKGKNKKKSGNRDPRRNYYFRVRTIKDKDGNIESALYGKIYGEFPFITYYLNPNPNDRNIEFDLKNNLFDGLKNTEQPLIP